ncbi:MAG: nucleotide sugar dehydrogenase [Pseudomonadota bacterium]|nr:nucleotide sugar dehydrogenase [Pseudomonadota bacterium]
MSEACNIVVVGLGYVGLPLAVALAEHGSVIGYDLDTARIAELQNGQDRTREVDRERLAASRLTLTADPADCAGADVYIVTVPTPIDGNNQPDLSPLLSASRAIAGWIDPARRPTIVYESTVYPGVTEDICGPEIERNGALKRGRDFRLGYSPERINPGDQVHRVEAIVKVVAGEDEEVVEQLAALYGAMTSGGVFRAASIKTAEAAKVIENAQRDINIAFMNEVSQIFGQIDLSIWDVLAAARTKWNFLPFEPGLVGGHCIGVDPYYLSHLAQKLGLHPQVVLAGRATNDAMGAWIADRLHEQRAGKPGRALVMGLTFKENVPDLRNSRTADIVRRLDALGYEVALTDPIANLDEAERDYGRRPIMLDGDSYDLVVAAVAHDEYRALDDDRLGALVAAGGTLADLKGMWRERTLAPTIERWAL